jgi:hypothetical protein
MSAKVYWAARDLDGPPVGNHQFVLITLGEKGSLSPIPALTEKSQRFVTLGGFAVRKRLRFLSNQSADVKAAREGLNPADRVKWHTADFDLERKRVTSPGGSDLAFAQKLVRLCLLYSRNEARNNVTYDLLDANCASWVNTLLKVAGVSKSERLKLGEFTGVDWGEEDKICEELFKSTVRKKT